MRQSYSFLHNCWHHYLYQKTNRKIYFLSPLAGEENFGWYIWLGCRGVYEMQFVESLQSGDYENSKFILKYYPHPDDELFDTFAFFEQYARFSDLFDNSPILKADGSMCMCSYIGDGDNREYKCLIKGIPKINSRKNLDPSLFKIGEIKFLFKNDELQQINATSQDILIHLPASGLDIEHQGQTMQILGPGEVDRRVLGWDLTWNFLSVFMKEVIGFNGLTPIKKQQDQQPGVITYYQKGGEIWTEKNEYLNQINCTLFYKEGA